MFKLLKASFIALLILATTAVIGVSGLYLYLRPQLPSIEGLDEVRLQVPLKIYSSDGALMGEFGEKKRAPKTFDEIPDKLTNAFLAAEDSRFYSHPGVDVQGLARAMIHMIKTGRRGQGGSTITMQLARNFYLTREKTFMRKISEIFLALTIESELDKKQILELYLNKIYLGNRAYGVASAARVYYGVELDQLTLAQIAMIAGLPKAPSKYNPIVNQERALERRTYVLKRMKDLGYISQQEYEIAISQPVTANLKRINVQVEASYVNEMVRAEIVNQFGDEAYTRGLNVYTTIKSKLQDDMNESLWNGVVDYDQRHGYRGPIRNVKLPALVPVKATNLNANEDTDSKSEIVDLLVTRKKEISDALELTTNFGRFLPVLISEIKSDDQNLADETSKIAIAQFKDGSTIDLGLKSVTWAKPYISVNRQGDAPKSVTEVLKEGDIVWVYKSRDGSWKLGQTPEVQGAMVTISPNDGAILALTGGFNFQRSKFNRATQAKRQAGSSFKPFIYSAALDKDFTPASIINDAPVVFEDAALEGSWRPENYSGKFYGPTRLREAIIKSRNLVSIRLLRAIGVGHATKFAENFGFNSADLPHDLSLSLGSCEVSPLSLATGFSVFANGGYRIKPYFIQRIEDADGRVLFEADPAVACVSCVLSRKNNQTTKQESVVFDEDSVSQLPKQADQTVEPRLVYLMNTMLQDVIRRGTGRKATSLGRKDIAGKTGTTNDQRDAWFSGYSPDLVTVAWLGFDHLKPLGSYETGSKAALPLWIDFMGRALKGVKDKPLKQPEGLVSIKINADTGELAVKGDKKTVFEIFRSENTPTNKKTNNKPAGTEKNKPIPEQVF